MNKGKLHLPLADFAISILEKENKMFNKKIVRQLIVAAVVSSGVVSARNALAMEKVSDATLANLKGGTKYTGPCQHTGYYNCVSVDDQCHTPLEGEDPDLNPDNYRLTSYGYYYCDGNASPTGTCDTLSRTYATVEKQYYTPNLLWACGNEDGAPEVVCTHPGCTP
jgi:hypothetical protein